MLTHDSMILEALDKENLLSAKNLQELDYLADTQDSA